MAVGSVKKETEASAGAITLVQSDVADIKAAMFGLAVSMEAMHDMLTHGGALLDYAATLQQFRAGIDGAKTLATNQTQPPMRDAGDGVPSDTDAGAQEGGD